MKQDKIIRLVIADDHKIFRDGLKLLFEKQKKVKLVGEAADGVQLVELVNATLPDVVMTDIVMPNMDGIAAVKRIVAAYPDIVIIALSMFDDEMLVVDMLEAGALGYLLKDADKEEILEAIHSAVNHRPYYCDAIMSKVIKLMSGGRFKNTAPVAPIAFNENELSIIQLICEEKTSREIAGVLSISPRTVEWYRTRIMEKLEVKSTIGIVIYALRNKLF